MLLQIVGFPSIFMADLFMCVCVYSHNIFIHSFINGHSGCFHVLAIVHNALRTWACRYLFNIVFLFPLHIFPAAELLDHMIVLVIL